MVLFRPVPAGEEMHGVNGLTGAALLGIIVRPTCETVQHNRSKDFLGSRNGSFHNLLSDNRTRRAASPLGCHIVITALHSDKEPRGDHPSNNLFVSSEKMKDDLSNKGLEPKDLVNLRQRVGACFSSDR
jgi:hypothetical protein